MGVSRGKIQSGETAQEGLKREIEEELGVSIIVLDKIFATIHSYFDKTVCLDFYRALPEDMDKFTPEPLDKQEFAWVDRRDLLTYVLQRGARCNGDVQSRRRTDCDGDVAADVGRGGIGRRGAGREGLRGVGRVEVRVVELDRIEADRQRVDLDVATGPREGRHDRLRRVVAGGGGVDRDPVLTVEDGGVSRVLELLLEFGDFALDLAAIDAGRTGRDELGLDLRDDFATVPFRPVYIVSMVAAPRPRAS